MPPNATQLRLMVRHSTDAKDQALANDLLRHLDVVQRFAGVDVWSEARIRAGDDWRRKITEAIDEADVVLLLLSADFFASDGLVEVEVPQLLERRRAGKLQVVPVLLRSCLWEIHPWLKELRPLPKDGKAIGSFLGEDRDAALTDVVRQIVEFAAPPPPTGDPAALERAARAPRARMVDELRASPAARSFAWQGSNIELRTQISARYMFLASENSLAVDGRVVARSGAFTSRSRRRDASPAEMAWSM